MGGTLPVLTAHRASRRVGRHLGFLLCNCNTWAPSPGVLLATWYPSAGDETATLFIGGPDLAVALMALRIAARQACRRQAPD